MIISQTQCLVFVILPRMEEDIQVYVHYLNSHLMRHNRLANCPSRVPNELFELPSLHSRTYVVYPSYNYESFCHWETAQFKWAFLTPVLHKKYSSCRVRCMNRPSILTSAELGLQLWLVDSLITVWNFFIRWSGGASKAPSVIPLKSSSDARSSFKWSICSVLCNWNLWLLQKYIDLPGFGPVVTGHGPWGHWTLSAIVIVTSDVDKVALANPKHITAVGEGPTLPQEDNIPHFLQCKLHETQSVP